MVVFCTFLSFIDQQIDIHIYFERQNVAAICVVIRKKNPYMTSLGLTIGQERPPCNHAFKKHLNWLEKIKKEK